MGSTAVFIKIPNADAAPCGIYVCMGWGGKGLGREHLTFTEHNVTIKYIIEIGN